VAPGHAGAGERERRWFLPLPAQGAPAPAAAPIAGHDQSGFSHGSHNPAMGYADPTRQRTQQGLDVAAERAAFSVAMRGIPDTTGTVIVDRRFAATRGENNQPAQLATNLGQGSRPASRYTAPYIAAYASHERRRDDERSRNNYAPHYSPFYMGPAHDISREFDNESPFTDPSMSTMRPRAVTVIPPGFSHNQGAHQAPPTQYPAQISSPVANIPHTAFGQRNSTLTQIASPSLGTTTRQTWNQQAADDYTDYSRI